MFNYCFPQQMDLFLRPGSFIIIPAYSGPVIYASAKNQFSKFIEVSDPSSIFNVLQKV